MGLGHDFHTFTSSNHPEVKHLALGIKGAVNYSSILTGTVNHEGPLKGIEVRHPLHSTKPLWPFFVTQENQSEQAVSLPTSEAGTSSDSRPGGMNRTAPLIVWLALRGRFQQRLGVGGSFYQKPSCLCRGFRAI